GEHFDAAARDAEPALDRLIRIGHAADRDRLRLPRLLVELFAQELRRVFLHQDLRLEVETGGEAEVLVGGARVTVDAAVLAAAIRIDAGVEADVGTVVRGDDRARRIAQVERLRRVLVALRFIVDGVCERLEAVLRVPAGGAAFHHQGEALGRVQKSYTVKLLAYVLAPPPAHSPRASVLPPPS